MTTRPEITLTHLDEAGAAYMVDVTAKTPTVREARATAFVACSEAIVDMVKGVDRGVELREAKVVAKSGGRSGDWVRGDRGDAA